MKDWPYNPRSKDALDKFTAVAKKRKELRQEAGISNEWSILFPDNDANKESAASQKSIECISLINSQDSAEDVTVQCPDEAVSSMACDNVQAPMEIQDDRTENYNNSSSFSTSTDNNLTALIEQMKIEFKVVKETNISNLEQLLGSLNFGIVIEKLKNTLCKQTLGNICIAFLSISCQKIESKDSETFYTNILLPLLQDSDVNRELEQAILEHVERNDVDIFKHIFVPLMSSNGQSCVMTVAVLSKINVKSKENLLRQFLKQDSVCNETVLPVVLMLFKAVCQPRINEDITEMMTSFLLSGSERFSKNINYGKIVHAVSQTLKEKFLNTAEDIDIRKNMIKVINDNETPFKNSCKTLLGLK